MNQLVHIYEVYALRYATQPERRSSANFMHNDLHDMRMPLDFYIWVIRNEDHTIVVDTGFNQEIAIKRSRKFLHCPSDLLKQLGICAKNVNDVVLTHMHYDHSGNINLFPNARLHIQEKEMEYCTGRSMAHDFLRMPFEMESVIDVIKGLYNNRICFGNGISEIAPDVTLHLVGGHTLGLQVVRIPTKRGYIVLASDAIHYWENINQGNPFPIVVDVEKMLTAHATIKQLADGDTHIIPGHDPQVLKQFVALDDCSDIMLLHEEIICENSN